jgi:hypothetical protein
MITACDFLQALARAPSIESDEVEVGLANDSVLIKRDDMPKIIAGYDHVFKQKRNDEYTSTLTVIDPLSKQPVKYKVSIHFIALPSGRFVQLSHFRFYILSYKGSMHVDCTSSHLVRFITLSIDAKNQSSVNFGNVASKTARVSMNLIKRELIKDLILECNRAVLEKNSHKVSSDIRKEIKTRAFERLLKESQIPEEFEVKGFNFRLRKDLDTSLAMFMYTSPRSDSNGNRLPRCKIEIASYEVWNKVSSQTMFLLRVYIVSDTWSSYNGSERQTILKSFTLNEIQSKVIPEVDRILTKYINGRKNKNRNVP